MKILMLCDSHAHYENDNIIVDASLVRFLGVQSKHAPDYVA